MRKVEEMVNNTSEKKKRNKRNLIKEYEQCSRKRERTIQEVKQSVQGRVIKKISH